MVARNLMIIAAAVAVSTPAWAIPYAFEVEAEVALVDDMNNVLGGSVYVGQPLLMSYAFDSDTTNTGAIPQVGDYWHYAGDYGMRVQVGPHDWRSDPSNLSFLVEMVNDYVGLDNYLLRSYNNIDYSGLSGPIQHMSWQLDDPSQTALTSTALPPLPPNLGIFQSWFGIDVEGGDMFNPFGGSFLVRSHATAIRTLPRIHADLVAPNDVLFQGTGFTPGGRLVAITAPSTGGDIVPGGACAGTNTGLNGPRMRAAFVANPDGTFSVSGRVGRMSGQQLVVFDVATCTPSPPITMP